MNLLRSNFKRGFGISAAIALASALSATTAFGFGAIFTIDNQGDAFWNNGGGLVPYTLTTDPSSGQIALQYTLPFTAGIGDVQLETSGGGPVTDILRFDGSDHVYFYSTTGTGTLGYVSTLPSPISPAVGPLLLQNSGGVWSVSYTPTSGQPGYDAAAPGSIYSIIVYVPEPGLMAFGVGSILLLGLRRTCKQK